MRPTLASSTGNRFRVAGIPIRKGVPTNGDALFSYAKSWFRQTRPLGSLRSVVYIDGYDLAEEVHRSGALLALPNSRGVQSAEG